MSYSYTITDDFNAIVPDLSVLSESIQGETGITVDYNYSEIDNDETLYIFFASALSQDEQLLLDNIVSNYQPEPEYEPPDLYIEAGTNIIKRKDSYGNVVTYIGNGENSVVISQDDQGDFTSIKEAFTNRNQPGTVYNVRPGIYIEDNPLILPAGSRLTSQGTPENTIIQAANNDATLIVMMPWTAITHFSLRNANIGLYYDASLSGQYGYAEVSECVIQDCLTGIEVEHAADTLICDKVKIHPLTKNLLRGFYIHDGATFHGTRCVVSGIPPYYTVESAFISSGPGTKTTINSGSIQYCGTGLVLNENAEFEINQLTSTGCNIGLAIGPTGMDNWFHSSQLALRSSQSYDVDILATDGRIIIAGEMDHVKINNPHNVKYNASYNLAKDNKNFQNFTGTIYFGSTFQPTGIVVGEGKYNLEDVVVLSNSDQEWLDNSVQARSSDGSSFDLFINGVTGDCCYIGSDFNILGLKINILTATNSNISTNDLFWEYWNGSSWQEFNIYSTMSQPPYYDIIKPIINNAYKQQIRFGLSDASPYMATAIQNYNKKWIRLRLATTLSNIPTFEYIKLHTSNVEINKDGFIEFTGTARPYSNLPICLRDFYPCSPGLTDTIHQLNPEISVPISQRTFPAGSNQSIAAIFSLPAATDLSFPLSLNYTFVTDNDNQGTIIWRIYWTSSRDGDNINGVSLNNHSQDVAMNILNKEQQLSVKVAMDCTDIFVHPEDANQSLIWLKIERMASEDTYPGNAAIYHLDIKNVIWASGYHI